MQLMFISEAQLMRILMQDAEGEPLTLALTLYYIRKGSTDFDAGFMRGPRESSRGR